MLSKTMLAAVFMAAAVLSAESSCSVNVAQKTEECKAPLMQAAGAGDLCGGWNNFQCCLIDSVASCGKSMQDEVKGTIATTMTTFKSIPQFSALEGCGAATCAGAPAPVPEKVTALMAGVTLPNPRDFDLQAFKDAVKKHTDASVVEVVLKGFEILAKYGVTDALDLSKVKAAIAKANSVEESQINIENNGRRLSSQRLLATKTTEIDVTITVPDADRAAAVMTSAEDVAKLGKELGQDVTMDKAPEATAKVETTLTSDPSLTMDTLTSKMAKAGSDVGGTVTVKEMPSSSPIGNTSSASSSFGALLAPVMILLTAMLAM